MHSTHTVLSSLLGILLVSSTVVGAPISNGPSTGDQLLGAPTRRVSTINIPGPYHARFGMPVAAAQGQPPPNGAPIDHGDNDNAIHARVVGLSDNSGIAGREVVARGVVDDVSGLLDGREVTTVYVPGSSDPSSRGSRHELPLIPPIKLPGRTGLAGTNTRDLASNNDAIDVRDLGPMSTMSLVDVITRSVTEKIRRREMSLPATESTHMARDNMSREDEEACRREGSTPVVDETGAARCTRNPEPKRGVIQRIEGDGHGRRRRAL